MGMTADVIGFGPMNQDIRKMEKNYPQDHYNDIPDETFFTETLFSVNSTHLSNKLAEALGIEDPQALGTHCINKQTRPQFLDEIDIGVLKELEVYDGQLQFLSIAYGLCNWTFFYRPNF